MSYSATVYEVLIASPSDVAKERQLIRDVIHEWNAIHATDKHTVMAPVSWETHASPEMGDHPQAIINKQIAHRCDLLVAVFWTRLGSPTSAAPSGTVEEIREHMKAGKPAMVYFSNEPVRPDSVDEEQYRALKAFKQECQQSGLYETYSSTSEFRDKFARQFAQTVLGRLTSPENPGTASVIDSLLSRPTPTVPDEARELLVAAADDAQGSVMKLGVMGGPIIRTETRQFGEQGNARMTARWIAAIDALLHEGYLEDRSGKGEIFYVTHEGFAAADRMRPEVG